MDATDRYISSLCLLLAEFLEHLDDLDPEDREWALEQAAEILQLVGEGMVTPSAP